ncbi:MAG: nitronate monooxygenase [Candidatus Omnitrophica bacterium]|nr:nitronate monooxygenase [Candidatus Omnitrophota bacterium]
MYNLKFLKPLNIGNMKIEIPIFQGGMGVKVSTASLASAVANCGAAGIIASVGLGYGTKDYDKHFVEASREGLRNEIREAKSLTKGAIGVNNLVALSNYEDLVKVAVEEKVDFIVSGAGLPLKLPGLTSGSDIKLIPIVSHPRVAGLIIKAWKKRYDRLPDAIMVEGPHAGGHLGFAADELKSDSANSLEAITKDVIGVVASYGVSIPIIVAGGIYTGADIAKFIMLGVSGVQMATRFVTTNECSVAKEFKDLYVATSNKDDLVIIDSPVGLPGRAIRTKFIDSVTAGKKMPIKCPYQCLKTCNPATAPYCIAEALCNASVGDIDNAVVFSGTNVTRIEKIISVKELIDELVHEAEAALSKLKN